MAIRVIFAIIVVLVTGTCYSLPTNTTQQDLKVRQQQQDVKLNYAVVVDCGSSGSRAHLYYWPANTPDNELAANLEQLRDPNTGKSLTLRIRPGLSSVKDHPDAASDYMRPIMRFASSHIPAEAQQRTPVFFMATAGLRLLSRMQQKLIQDDIARDLKLEFNFPKIYTEVISGAEEGLFQWLSLNAHSERLSDAYNQKPDMDFFCQAPRARRVGMLEMGGASAQVTFEASPILYALIRRNLVKDPEALSVFRDSRFLYNNTQIISTTFLGMGANNARNLATDLLVKDFIRQPLYLGPYGESIANLLYGPGSTLIIQDPCLPLGSEETLQKPIELLTNRSHNIGFTPDSAEDTFDVRLYGIGNHIVCHKLLKRVIVLIKRERYQCSDYPCETSLIGTEFVPFRYLQFTGFGEFFYTTDSLMKASGKFISPQIQAFTKRICSTDFDTLTAQYPRANDTDPNRVLLSCFKAQWVLVWLHIGLRMPIDFMIDFTTANKINGKESDWTFGALLAKSIEGVS